MQWYLPKIRIILGCHKIVGLQDWLQCGGLCWQQIAPRSTKWRESIKLWKIPEVKIHYTTKSLFQLHSALPDMGSDISGTRPRVTSQSDCRFENRHWEHSWLTNYYQPIIHARNHFLIRYVKRPRRGSSSASCVQVFVCFIFKRVSLFNRRIMQQACQFKVQFLHENSSCHVKDHPNKAWPK